MSTFFHCDEVTGIVDSNYLDLQGEACQMIIEFCQKFGLDEHVEFACFELAHEYLKNVLYEILSGGRCSGCFIAKTNPNEYIQQAMLTVDTNLPLTLLSIISIVAKYFGATNWLNMFKTLPKILLATGRLVSFKELYHSEFIIFRKLEFCVRCNVYLQPNSNNVDC